jgi:hypothetical protein
MQAGIQGYMKLLQIRKMATCKLESDKEDWLITNGNNNDNNDSSIEKGLYILALLMLLKSINLLQKVEQKLFNDKHNNVASYFVST